MWHGKRSGAGAEGQASSNGVVPYKPRWLAAAPQLATLALFLLARPTAGAPGWAPCRG